MEPARIVRRVQLWDLPLEIRQYIYEDYLEDRRHPPARVIHEEPLSATRLHWQPDLFTVNKQMTKEITDLCRRCKTFTCRITWQEFDYDAFTKSCIRARAEKLDYGDMQHLRVEIYPPHRDRPMDMAHIWRNMQSLCSGLDRKERLQHLSIVFLENKFGSWSRNRKPWNSMGLYYLMREEFRISDICYIFDLLKTLNNVAKASIYLPESLMHDKDLQLDREKTEQAMMDPSRFKMMDRSIARDIEDRINNAVPHLKAMTASRSRAKIKAICNHGLNKISPEELLRLKEVWPYSDIVIVNGIVKAVSSISPKDPLLESIAIALT